jgi:hypothetical protein
MQSDRIAYQILRPSLAEKCLKKITISFLNICFYLAKFFHFTAQRRSEQENVRFIINEDTD